MLPLQNNPSVTTFNGFNRLSISHFKLRGDSSGAFISPQDWWIIFSKHPFLQLLRPDYFIVFEYTNPVNVIYQENIRLDLGVKEVTYNLLRKYSKPSDISHWQRVDSVIDQFTRECRLQPFDYVFKTISNIECPNESVRRLMRTSFIAQCDEQGNATHGIKCFHDVTVLVNSIRPNNYDITFAPEKADLCHEAYQRLKNAIPKSTDCTKRESEIIHCLDLGLSSKEIAASLFISKTTVDTHRQNMLRKWCLPNTPALLRKSKEEGWL